jgi:hypothetical protein
MKILGWLGILWASYCIYKGQREVQELALHSVSEDSIPIPAEYDSHSAYVRLPKWERTCK